MVRSRETLQLFFWASILIVVFTCSHAVEADHHEPRLIVIGDSLSTTLNSWPNQLRRIAPRWNIHVMAQNGRTIRDFSIPRDLWTAGDKQETVVYFLGANDILQRNHVFHAKSRLMTHLDFLLDRNFKVLLIVPPRFNVDQEMFAKSIEEHRAMIESCRGTRENLWVYDMEEIWDSSQTPDGVHPTSTLSYEMALIINYVLGMNIY